jgi:hypothetical protein
MSPFNRRDPWAEPTQTTNANRRRVFDEDDDTSNMQMARRAQQPSCPSQSTTSGALIHRATERNHPAERVESWRDEKRGEDPSGAMSRMHVSEGQPAASRPRHRPHSSSLPPSPPQRRERETPRRPAARQRAPSPSPPPPRRRPSPAPARNRRAPSPDWNEGEPVRTRQPRRHAPRSPSPPPSRTRRACSLSPSENLLDDDFGIRRRTRSSIDFGDEPPPRSRTLRPSSNANNNSSSFSYSITTTSYSSGSMTSSRTQSTVNGRRMRDTYRSTRHQPGMQHDPGCPFCFSTQGGAVRAATEWCAAGEDCWVEWDAHGFGLWGVVFDVDGCDEFRTPDGRTWWYS